MEGNLEERMSSLEVSNYRNNGAYSRLLQLKIAPKTAGLHYDEMLDCHNAHKSFGLRPALTELYSER